MDVEKGCFLPLAQSVISGILAGLVALAVGLWQGWSAAGYIAFAMGAGSALLVWVGGLTAWRREVYRPPVEFLPVSNNLETDQAPARVKVELAQTLDGGRHVQIAELPVSARQLETLAAGLLAGQSFSEGAWCGDGRPFSKGEFHQLRSEFLKRGWASWRNTRAPAQGVTLTRPGAAVMRSFASDTILPYREQDILQR